MELRKSHNLTVQAKEPSDRTTKIAIILAVGGLILFALPSLFAWTMKSGMEKAMKHGDAQSGAGRPGQAAKPVAIDSKPSADTQRYATALTNIAAERRVLGTKMTRLVVVGVDFQTDTGQSHPLELTLNLGATEAAAFIASEPVRYTMPEFTANHRIQVAYDGALPEELGARDRALIAVRDANLPPARPVQLDTQDKSTRERLCASLHRWIDYYGVTLEDVTYWYVADPKVVKVSSHQVIGKSKLFKIYSYRTLSEHCPSLRKFDEADAKRSKF